MNTNINAKQRWLAVFTVFFLFILVGGILGFVSLQSKWAHEKLVQEAKIRKYNAEILPETMTWSGFSTSTPGWEKRDSHMMYLFNDKLWLTGGLNAEEFKGPDGDPLYDQATYFNDIWNTDGEQKWTLMKKNASFPPIRSASIVNYKDTLYMLGGWSPSKGYNNGIWTSTNGVDWKQVSVSTPFPVREGQEIIEFNDQLWLFGGVNYENKKRFNDTWTSTDGLNWIKITDTNPWAPRWDGGFAVFNDQIWLISGMSDLNTGYADIWTSVDGKNWKLITDKAPWGTLQGHTLVNYKNYLWLISGLDTKTNTENKDIWYSANGKDWEKTKYQTAWAGREDHQAEVFKNKIWITGGMTGSLHWSNETWLSNLNTRAEESNRLEQAWKDFNFDSLTAKSVLVSVIDKNNKILLTAGKDPEAVRPIASISKLVTALVVKNNFDLNESIHTPAGTYHVKELLKTILFTSDNRSAEILSTKIGSNNFIQKMNEAVSDLSLPNTKFYNVTGLDPIDTIGTEYNVSTAMDLTKIALYIYRSHPELISTNNRFEEDFCDVNGICQKITNTNLILGKANFPYKILGGKTGSTPDSDTNLVLVMQYNDTDLLISVVLGSKDHFKDTENTINQVKIKQ